MVIQGRIRDAGQYQCQGVKVPVILVSTVVSTFDSCVFRLHHSRGRRGCSGGLLWAYRPGASLFYTPCAIKRQCIRLSAAKLGDGLEDTSELSRVHPKDGNLRVLDRRGRSSYNVLDHLCKCGD